MDLKLQKSEGNPSAPLCISLIPPPPLFPSNCRKAPFQEKWEEAKNTKRGNQRRKVENLKVCRFYNLARTNLYLSCRSGPLGGDESRNSVRFWFYLSSSTDPHPKNFFKNSNQLKTFIFPVLHIPIILTNYRKEKTTNIEAPSKITENKAKYQPSPP